MLKSASPSFLFPLSLTISLVYLRSATFAKLLSRWLPPGAQDLRQTKSSILQTEPSQWLTFALNTAFRKNLLLVNQISSDPFLFLKRWGSIKAPFCWGDPNILWLIYYPSLRLRQGKIRKTFQSWPSGQVKGLSDGGLFIEMSTIRWLWENMTPFFCL